MVLELTPCDVTLQWHTDVARVCSVYSCPKGGDLVSVNVTIPTSNNGMHSNGKGWDKGTPDSALDCLLHALLEAIPK